MGMLPVSSSIVIPQLDARETQVNAMVKIAALSNPGSKLINNLILQGLHFQQVVFRWAHPHGGLEKTVTKPQVTLWPANVPYLQ